MKTFLNTLISAVLALSAASAFAEGVIGNQRHHYTPTPQAGTIQKFDGYVWAKGFGGGMGQNDATGHITSRLNEAGSQTESDTGLNLGVNGCGGCDANSTSAYAKMRNLSFGTSVISTNGNQAGAISGTESNLAAGAMLKKMITPSGH